MKDIEVEIRYETLIGITGVAIAFFQVKAFIKILHRLKITVFKGEISFDNKVSIRSSDDYIVIVAFSLMYTIE